jgi:hypothetical protein
VLWGTPVTTLKVDGWTTRLQFDSFRRQRRIEDLFSTTRRLEASNPSSDASRASKYTVLASTRSDQEYHLAHITQKSKVHQFRYDGTCLSLSPAGLLPGKSSSFLNAFCETGIDFLSQAQTPEQRRRNLKFAKDQDARRGKAESEIKKRAKDIQKSPISPIWLGKPRPCGRATQRQC